ncbi:MAG: glycerol-3-phosphate 1-O-acyltransferase PlsY [Betaproteobacteria bacterium]|nr:glycerol-3-phosphate 1-O-acyltransferase PlsY [Betaproteobacteria bacterium]
MATAIAILIGYLIGSLSFAVIVSRLLGLPDPHSYGSGNPGATNVLRTGHKVAAVLTLAGDAAKGWFAVWLVRELGSVYGVDEAGAALTGLAAFLGHLFPVYFAFKGGKGVATAAGILFALSPWLGLGTLATWLIIAVFFRYSSLAALVAAVFAPFWALFLNSFRFDVTIAAISAMCALLVWRHRTNIRNLLEGREGRIGQRRTGSERTTDTPQG